MFRWSRSAKFISGPTSWRCSQDSLTQWRDYISKSRPAWRCLERPTVDMMITLGGPLCHFCYWHCHCVGTAQGSVYHFISDFPTENWRLQLPLYCCCRSIPAMWAETQKTYSLSLWREDLAYTQDTCSSGHSVLLSATQQPPCWSHLATLLEMLAVRVKVFTENAT